MNVVSFLSVMHLIILYPPSCKDCGHSGETAPHVPTSILLLGVSSRPWNSEFILQNSDLWKDV